MFRVAMDWFEAVNRVQLSSIDTQISRPVSAAAMGECYLELVFFFALNEGGPATFKDIRHLVSDSWHINRPLSFQGQRPALNRCDGVSGRRAEALPLTDT